MRREAGTGKRSSPSQNHTPHAVSILALRPESAPQLPSALASARVDLSLRPDLSRLLCCLGFSLGASRLVFSSESICKFCESAREQSPVRSVSMDSFCITQYRVEMQSNEESSFSTCLRWSPKLDKFVHSQRDAEWYYAGSPCRPVPEVQGNGTGAKTRSKISQVYRHFLNVKGGMDGKQRKKTTDPCRSLIRSSSCFPLFV